jgi:hypothetical protein
MESDSQERGQGEEGGRGAGRERRDESDYLISGQTGVWRKD